MMGYDAKSHKKPIYGSGQRQAGMRVLPLRKSTQKRKGEADPSTLTFLSLLLSPSFWLGMGVDGGLVEPSTVDL